MRKKICVKCHKQKPLSAFGEYKPGERTSWCKQCAQSYKADHYPPVRDGQLHVVFDRKVKRNDSK